MVGDLTLSDGRTLQWIDNGIDAASALLFHHGTTLSAEVWNAWLAGAASRGVRAVAVNRAGVDRSSRHEGRRVTNDVADARELLDHLDIGSFVAIGWSGGGARALGSGLLAGCRAVHTVAGISPRDLNDPETLAGLSDSQIEQLAKQVADYAEVTLRRGATYDEDVNLSSEAVLGILSQYANFAEYEVEYREFAVDYWRSVQHALVQGVATDADDFFANINPWGFALEDVTVPVTIWHGEADDDVLIDRGEYNHCHLPNSEFKRLPGQGHVSILVEARQEVLTSAISSLGLQDGR